MLAVVLFGTVLLGGCATTGANGEDSQYVEYDPWEPMNRKIHAFNMGVDKAVLRPIAKGYKKVVPSPVRRSVTNFFSNLATPRSALNNFLQGKPKQGFTELGRFVVNSIVGIGGLFNVAGKAGIERHDENFAQTLSKWGVPDGPYIVLPFWGPNMLSDTFALPVDYYTDAWTHYDNTSVRDKVQGVRMIDLRHRLLTIDSELDESPDPYVKIRELYRDNRTFRIFDGDPPRDADVEDDLAEALLLLEEDEAEEALE